MNRVFEKTIEDSVWRVEFNNSQFSTKSQCVAGQCKGQIGGEWHIMDCLKDCKWREIEPFDITKLDTAGVFHEAPAPVKPNRYFYYPNLGEMFEWGPIDTPSEGFVEFPRPDIANATIAELRARVAELEGQVTKANNRAEMEFLERQLAATKRIEHYDNCLCELRRQLQAAWMRNDLTTADRIADLIGDRRPSEHEAADAGEVRA